MKINGNRKITKGYRFKDDNPINNEVKIDVDTRIDQPDKYFNVTIPNLRVKKKREYIKGGRGGKIKGFNFYLRNERITKKQRKTLLIESENFESPLDIKFHKPNPHSPPHPFYHGFDLDPSLSDEELMEEWNEIYDRYGYCYPQFKDQWEREQTRGFNKHFKENKCRDKDKSNIKGEYRIDCVNAN